MKIGTGVEFNFGGLRVNFDAKNNQLNLCNGSFFNTLLLEKADYPIVVASGSTLQVNTLVAEKAVFKNKGVFKAFIAVLQDCPTVKNG